MGTGMWCMGTPGMELACDGPSWKLETIIFSSLSFPTDQLFPNQIARLSAVRCSARYDRVKKPMQPGTESQSQASDIRNEHEHTVDLL